MALASGAMEPAELRDAVVDLRSRLAEARNFLDIDGKQAELVELRERASAPDLWDDRNNAKAVTSRLVRHEATIKHITDLEGSIEDVDVLLQLAVEEGDKAALVEVQTEIDSLLSELSILERESLFFGDYDDSPAILSINAGAGGVDAQDWAEMLLRMYTRYLERSTMTFEVDDYQEGEEAGIKSVTLTIKGTNAYGTFESERGTHRLVRISPFDSAARRHTAFAGVDVIPQVDVEQIEIDAEDLRIDTYRASGAGGQHINKTDSAVRITHEPTGIVVSCQAERSQMQNKTRAMQLLVARLAEKARQDQAIEVAAIRGDQHEAAWGRQIRSYVMHPYQMVKDLRTDYEVGNIQGVLDGDIDGLVDSYLSWRRSELYEA
ncbi:MAG: peptide chain release factor 2 [Acidimicrobiia bacterium]|nr:MAG: peptide chain release factor 2 [Acidimicrobiia bacterium]